MAYPVPGAPSHEKETIRGDGKRISQDSKRMHNQLDEFIRFIEERKFEFAQLKAEKLKIHLKYWLDRS